MIATLLNNDIFSQISLRIIREQELIIGPIAIDEAKKVPGFHLNNLESGEVSFDGDAKDVLNRLVAQYEKLFGKISHEVCKEAVQDLVAEMAPADVPESLK